VLKAVGHRPDMPYIAVLTHGFPRLTTLNAELLLPTHDGHELPFGVRARVLVRDDTAVIPDLEQLEETLSEMLAEA
jgi:chemosensory pili system protein ChpC